MNAQLEAIQIANDTGEHAEAVKLADAYVKAHPAEFAGYQSADLPACVSAIDVFRAAWQGKPDEGIAGFEPALEQHVRMQAWIFHAFEFQDINGEYKATARPVLDAKGAN